MDEIERSGFDKYYVDHTLGLWPQAAGGTPFNACVFQSKGDPITDLFEDMAAEQKARSTYDNILRLVHDSEVCEPIRFLRAREIVHFQRFGEAMRTDLSGIEANVSVILTDTFAFLISIMLNLKNESYFMNYFFMFVIFLPWQTKRIFITVIKLLKLPRNAMFCVGFRGVVIILFYMSTEQIIAYFSKL